MKNKPATVSQDQLIAILTDFYKDTNGMTFEFFIADKLKVNVTKVALSPEQHVFVSNVLTIFNNIHN